MSEGGKLAYGLFLTLAMASIWVVVIILPFRRQHLGRDGRYHSPFNATKLAQGLFYVGAIVIVLHFVAKFW